MPATSSAHTANVADAAAAWQGCRCWPLLLCVHLANRHLVTLPQQQAQCQRAASNMQAMVHPAPHLEQGPLAGRCKMVREIATRTKNSISHAILICSYAFNIQCWPTAGAHPVQRPSIGRVEAFSRGSLESWSVLVPKAAFFQEIFFKCSRTQMRSEPARSSLLLNWRLRLVKPRASHSPCPAQLLVLALASAATSPEEPSGRQGPGLRAR
jgi:hypothetical protein